MCELSGDGTDGSRKKVKCKIECPFNQYSVLRNIRSVVQRFARLSPFKFLSFIVELLCIMNWHDNFEYMFVVIPLSLFVRSFLSTCPSIHKHKYNSFGPYTVLFIEFFFAQIGK